MSPKTTQSLKETDNRSLGSTVEDILRIPEPADDSYVKQILRTRDIKLNTLVPKSEYVDEDLHEDLICEKYNRKAGFGIIKEIKPHEDGKMIGILVQLPFGGVIESEWYRPGYPKNDSSTWLSNIFKYSNANSISELPGTLIPIYPVTDSDEYMEDMRNDEPPFRFELSQDRIESERWPPRINQTGDTSSSSESSNIILGILEIFSF